MTQPSFLARRTCGQPNYLLIALAVALVVAFLPRGTRRAIESNNNKAEDWLPSNYAESRDLQWFRRHFGGEQFALISWDGLTLGNQEHLQALAKKLAPGDQAARVDPTTEWFSRVISGPSEIEALMAPPLSLDYNDAVSRLEGALVGPPLRDADGKSLGNDTRTTCLVVYLSEKATRNNKAMRAAIDRIVEIASTECAIPESTIHMGGPPVDNITIDIEGERTLMRLASLSGIVGLVLAYWCFRSVKLTGIVFAVGAISAAMSLAIVFYYGAFEVLVRGYSTATFGTVDAILMSMPAVVYVLGLSGAIHIVNYYRDARMEGGGAGAAEAAVRTGWAPCALAALTTAVGLGTLYTSDIVPIKKFGAFTAVAVLGTLGVLFTILPVFLHRFPPRKLGSARQNRAQGGATLPGWGYFIAHFVIRRHAIVCLFWAAVLVLFGFGLTRIETSVQLLKLLDEDADLVHDYAWLEQNLGNLVPMEVIVTVPPERRRTGLERAEEDGQQYRMTMFERLQMIRLIQHRIEALDEISRAMSVATIAPLPTDSGFDTADISGDYAINKSLEDNRELFLQGDYLREEFESEHGDKKTGRELWRVFARVAALSDDEEGIDYGRFVKDLQVAVAPVLRAYRQRDLLVRALHGADREKALRDSRFCILFRDPRDVDTPSEQTQERMFEQLLRATGLVKKQQIVKYNLALFDREQDPDRQATVVDKLKEFDAVLLISAGSDPTAKKLAERGVLVVDLADVADVQGSAATMLAAGPEPRPIRAAYTGVVPVVYKTQRELLFSLRESIAWATVLIALVMMCVLKSPSAGLASMIPNVFPIIMVFGALGWLGIKVDIGIMMTASVALGVAVDDTVHFLTWFRRGMREGRDRRAATLLAYERCATAMTQTTIIGGLGLAVFATSTFTPTQQFGYLMITMLGAALVGDLLLLPAILAGPVGKFFCARLRPDTAATTSEDLAPSLPDDSSAGAATSGPHIDLSPPSAFSQPVPATAGDEATESLRKRLRTLRRDTSHSSTHLS